MNTRAAHLVLCVMTTLLIGACESPTDGFESFYAAVADGRADDAVARLTDPARTALEQGAKAANLSLADALAQTTVRSTLRQVEEVSRDGDTAIVEVTDALGHKERTRMKKVEGRWKVDGAAQ